MRHLGLVVLVFALSHPASATTLLRDADIEYGLKQLATPILRAAGLNPNRVKVLVVDDGTLNAFVVSQDAIFIHSGLITKLTSARQLQAVIAHEAAHIANGHITRRMGNLGAARTAAALGLALAIAAAAASGDSRVAAGVAAGVQKSALGRFFAHTRAEESSADTSALRYLRSAGIDPRGMAEVLAIFRGQEVLAETRRDAYARSHPLSRDRIRRLQAEANASKTYAERPTDAYWFARAKGKLSAFIRGPKFTQRRAGESGYADIKAMRLAVAHFRQSQTKKALRQIDKAIAARPPDPFLLDLKAEIMMKTRQFGKAASVYGQAAKAAPNEPLILSGYGRALLANGQTQAALKQLERARSIDYRDGHMLRDLAQAYAKLKRPGMAALVTAERYALRGDMRSAGTHAKRATDLLPDGSGPWQRAQDVLIASKRLEKLGRK